MGIHTNNYAHALTCSVCTTWICTLLYVAVINSQVSALCAHILSLWVGVGQEVSEQGPGLLLGWFKYRCHYVEREGRSRERGRLPTECRAQSRAWSHNPEIMTWAEIKSQMLNWLSHPSTPLPCFSEINPFKSHKRIPVNISGINETAISVSNRLGRFSQLFFL